MAYPIETKDKAIQLRKGGYSLNEIHEELSVSRSTLSTWLYNTVLSEEAKKRLLNKIKKGQLVSAENKKNRARALELRYSQNADKLIDLVSLDRRMMLLLCSLIYWCEGAKDSSRMEFVNSDPMLVKTFLSLLRDSLPIDEQKFRAVVHLHEYHDIKKQIWFWSKVTNIPFQQFSKPFLKKHTGKRTRKGYNGCVSIRYHDTNSAKLILSTAKAFISKYGCVG